MAKYIKPVIDVIEIENEQALCASTMGIDGTPVSGSIMKAPGMSDWDDEE